MNGILMLGMLCNSIFLSISLSPMYEYSYPQMCEGALTECDRSLPCQEAIAGFWGSICRGGGDASIIASSLKTSLEFQNNHLEYIYETNCLEQAACLLAQQGKCEQSCTLDALYSLLNSPYDGHVDFVADLICCLARENATLAQETLVALIERQGLLLPALSTYTEIGMLDASLIEQTVAPLIALWGYLLGTSDYGICSGLLCPAYITLVQDCTHPVVLTALLMALPSHDPHASRLLDQLCSCLLPRMLICPSLGLAGVAVWLAGLATTLVSAIASLVITTGHSAQELGHFVCALCQCQAFSPDLNISKVIVEFLARLDLTTLPVITQALSACDKHPEF